MFQQIPIFHMASMARSGETLMMRCMAAHPRVLYSHNLWASDSRRDGRLFRHLKKRRATSIAVRHPLLRHKAPRPTNVLFVKQGAWEHAYPFRGFVLARNPLAIFASMKTFDSEQRESPRGHCWQQNLKRLQNWMGDIEPALVPKLAQLTPLEQFVLFYRRRMGALADLDLPVVLYERLVLDPATELARVCAALELDFDPALLNSHEQYRQYPSGHGKSDLSRPISSSSLEQYKTVLFDWERERIAQACADVAAAYGYDMSQGDVRLRGEAAPSTAPAIERGQLSAPAGHAG